jgi:hypothetical protein
MKDSEQRFWPFRPRTSIVGTIAILIGLLLVFVILRGLTNWPGEKSETTVLIGILLFSLLPVLLSLVDALIERGGVIEYGGVKIDFSNVPAGAVAGLTVPVNIGVAGQGVTDSSTTQILDALRQATACEVVIIDLEDGQAWWETRLLILLAGAVRLRRPERVIFVGKDGGVDRCFQGWGVASKLLRCLLQAHPQYPLSYHKAMAAARQWEMVEPSGAGIMPPQPGWMQLGLATQHQWIAFENKSGLPNALLAEQYLANELGNEVESKEQPRKISVSRLQELFRPVLYKNNLDESWPAERQIEAFFASDFDYIAVTQSTRYNSLVSRVTLLNSIVKQLISDEKKAKK